jgi:TRAP-type C4-dicarboxylate transport system substrate-binding protein
VRKRLRIFGLAALGLATAMLLLPEASVEAQRRGRRSRGKQLKLAFLAPENTTWAQVMEDFNKELLERTEGRLGFRLYMGGVQGDEKVVLRKIKVGQLDGGGFTGMGMGEIVSEVRLLEVPFQFETYEEADLIRNRIDARIHKRFREEGYELLGWFELGFVHLFSTRKLRTVKDVQAAKPWVWEGDPLATAYFQAFDVDPIPLPLPDVMTSLQTGMVDTVYQSPMATVGFQWYTKVDYQSDVPLADACGGLLLKSSVFENIPVNDRAILSELSLKYAAEVIRLTREENERAKETLANEGIEVVAFDEAERATFQEYGKKVSYQLAGEGRDKLFPKAMLDEMYELLDAHRAEKSGAGSSGEGGGEKAAE